MKAFKTARSLQIKDAIVKEAIFGGLKNGPPSIANKQKRAAYIQPIGLTEAFAEATKVIEQEREAAYKAIKSAKLPAEIERLEVVAEKNNPEVIYNFKSGSIDYSEPIYRHLAQKEWTKHELPLLMQRLEQLAVIPDTMPTLDPKAQVQVEFVGPVQSKVVPGTVLPNIVCDRQPLVHIREFETIPDESLYTIVLVDPDTPDLTTDSYKTTLHWLVTNIPISNDKALAEGGNEIASYLPPHPEKNTGLHRYCLWVYRQDKRLEVGETSRDFDIRKFSADHSLLPVGAHVFRVGFDRSTTQVREKHGLGKGTVYRRVRTV